MRKGSKMSLESRKKLSESVKNLYRCGANIGFQKGHKFVGVKINEIMKGKNPWNYGKKLPYKPRLGMTKVMMGNIYGFRKGHIPWNKGKGHLMRGKFPKGSKHWAWKGGTRELRKNIQDTQEYRDWRAHCFRRDKYTCILCGNTGRLVVDHIKPFSEIIKENKIKTLKEALNCKELWDISNGRTLCEDCHRETPTYGNKMPKKKKVKKEKHMMPGMPMMKGKMMMPKGMKKDRTHQLAEKMGMKY